MRPIDKSLSINLLLCDARTLTLELGDYKNICYRSYVRAGLDYRGRGDVRVGVLDFCDRAYNEIARIDAADSRCADDSAGGDRR